MKKISNLLKLFWEPGPQWYLRRSYQLLSAQPMAPWCWSASNPSPSAHPIAALSQSMCSSFQLINLAAGSHHTLLPWPRSLCWARGKEGLQMLLRFYFWHTPGVTCAEHCSHPRAEMLHPPWERSGDEALMHADLAVISVPLSKTKVQGNSLFSTALLPLCTSGLGFACWQHFPRTLWSGVGAAPGRWLRKFAITQVHPNRKFLSGSDSNQSRAWDFAPKCF